MAQLGFPLSNHLTFTPGGGGVTASLPYTDVTATGADEDEARLAFGLKYLEVLKGSLEERDKTMAFIKANGGAGRLETLPPGFVVPDDDK